MTSENTYPAPDRSNYTPQQNLSNRYLPELDLGQFTTELPDGRPAIVEDWLDKEYAIHCRTVWYSAIDTDEWDEADHYDLIQQAGLLKAKVHPSEGIGLKRQEDASGQDVWSATVVMRDVD
jgi:hypothetical protein